MEKTRPSAARTEKLVLSALMTALVIVFQLLATYTTFFGPFSTALALLPIIVGAALCGPLCGAWLGLCFGLVVLATGGASLFWIFSIGGSIVTVLVKGAAAGLLAGLSYRLLGNTNRLLAAVVASLLCPVVNTGVFLAGSALFFLPYACDIAALISSSASGMEVFYAMAFGNFAVEVLMCVLLCPVVMRLIALGRKKSR